MKAYSYAKKRRRVFALFKPIFLRNRSLSNAIGDFTVKNVKLGKENCLSVSTNEIRCAADNHSYRPT